MRVVLFRWILSVISIIVFFIGYSHEIKFCLVMVVQDQDAIIRDCFKSIEEWVDAACIIDTGSSDWTYYVAEEWLHNTHLPGIVYRYKKKEGDPHRVAYQLAQRFLEEKDFSLDSTYFLFLDADMTVEFLPEFHKNGLDQDGYLILNKCSSLGCSIYDLHLIKASLFWPSISDPVKLQNIVIEGGSTDLSRSIKFFMGSSENNRHLLQLAQRCKGTKEYEVAIEWYLKRIAQGGEREELWFSKFMIGSCYEKLDQWEKALHWYMEAFQMCPDHPDSIRNIATHYRYKGKNHLAYLFAQYGSDVKRSLSQYLFDYPPLRDYHFDEEASITAYYTKFRKEGLAFASDLSLRKNIPYWIREQNGRNIFYYSPFLKQGRHHCISFDLPSIISDLEEKYHPKSFSLLKTKTGYQCILTAVNYTQTGEKIIQTIDPTGVFRNKSFLIQLDPSFHVIDQKEIIDNLAREKFSAFNVEGIEDYRLFEWNGAEWFTCITNDTNPTGLRQISLGKLSDGISTVEIERLTPLFQKDIYKEEKHWLPLVKNSELLVLSSYDPLIFLSPDIKTGECNISLMQKSLLSFASFKGSAGPISLDDGYLLLTHETVRYPDDTFAYLHRFLFLNSSFQPEKISHSFAFLHQGIERCYGMTIDHSGSELIFSLTSEDKQAYIFSLSINEIRSLLHPLPEADVDPF